MGGGMEGASRQRAGNQVIVLHFFFFSLSSFFLTLFCPPKLVPACLDREGVHPLFPVLCLPA